MIQKQIVLGMTGMGGFAGHMLKWLIHEHNETLPVRLAAVCEPHPERFPEIVAELAQRGIALRTNYMDLLDESIDAVYLPIPIQLHRLFTERALAAGKPVLCEKPAAGCIDEVDGMIADRDRAQIPVAIAFQDVYQPKLHELKQRLLAGEFGRVKRVRVLACWPRDEAYFLRNDWAGRIQRGGQWILDSPANNAMAHFIHLCLFLLGDESRAASPTRVEAELYRVNNIENYDTCSLRLSLRNHPPILIGMTHASIQQIDAEISIITDRGHIRYLASKRIETRIGQTTEEILLDGPMQLPMFQAFRDHVWGGPQSTKIGTLEMARSHAVVVSAASEAARIIPLSGKNSQRITDSRGAVFHTIPHIDQLLRQSIDKDQMLHESGLADWTHPAATIDTESYCHFQGPPAVEK